jgi:hypothetical protein
MKKLKSGEKENENYDKAFEIESHKKMLSII